MLKKLIRGFAAVTDYMADHSVEASTLWLFYGGAPQIGEHTDPTRR